MTEILLTLFLPLTGSIFLLFINKEKIQLIRIASLTLSVLSFVAAMVVLFGFNSANPGF